MISKDNFVVLMFNIIYKVYCLFLSLLTPFNTNELDILLNQVEKNNKNYLIKEKIYKKYWHKNEKSALQTFQYF